MDAILLLGFSKAVSVCFTGAHRVVIQVIVHFCSDCCLIIVACLDLRDPLLQVVYRRVGDYLRYLVDQVLKAIGSGDLCPPPDTLAALRLLARVYKTCLSIAERCEASARPEVGGGVGQSRHCTRVW